MSIPSKEHYAIITTNKIYIPGDERSRTNPGHGYPEHYQETIDYEAYTDFVKFESRIVELVKRGTKFNAIHALPVTVETNVSVRVKL